jgi:predicted lipid-binding transport protein (Tim44 family)
MSQSVADLNNSRPYDSQQIAEAIDKGEVKAPQVDVAADYEASKEFSVSEIDRTEEGAKAAEAATAPKFELKQPEETHSEAKPTGDPTEFIEMAKELNPFPEA